VTLAYAPSVCEGRQHGSPYLFKVVQVRNFCTSSTAQFVCQQEGSMPRVFIAAHHVDEPVQRSTAAVNSDKPTNKPHTPPPKKQQTPTPSKARQVVEGLRTWRKQNSRVKARSERLCQTRFPQKKTKSLSKSPKSPRSPTPAQSTSFPLGSIVEARWNGQNNWLRGKIVAKRPDGSLDVHYRCGLKEVSVQPDLVRKLQHTPVASSPATPTPKTPKKRRETDKRTDKCSVEVHHTTPQIKTPPRTSFEHGSAVEALYAGGPKWYAGRISKAHGNDKYDVDYDDGDKESFVPAHLIRLLGVRRRRVKQFLVGQRVEVQCCANGEWELGRVHQLVAGDRYAVNLIETQRKVEVRRAQMRSVSRTNQGGPAETPVPVTHRPAGKLQLPIQRNRKESPDRTPLAASERVAHKEFNEGDRVKVKFLGGLSYAGCITKVLPSGKCNILYDDGDEETAVRPSLISRIESVSNKANSNVKSTTSGRAVRSSSRLQRQRKIQQRSISKNLDKVTHHPAKSRKRTSPATTRTTTTAKKKKKTSPRKRVSSPTTSPTQGTSKFRGVSWNRKDQRWVAKIRVNGRQYFLGNFKDEDEAARRYDKEAKRCHGKGAILNFPRKK